MQVLQSAAALPVQPSGSGDKGVALGALFSFRLELTLFLSGRDDHRCGCAGTFCGLPFCFCAAQLFPVVLQAQVFGKRGVQIQNTKISQLAGFSIFAAGVLNDFQLFPPCFNIPAQLPAGLCQIIGFVQPLGHKQAVKGDKLPQFSDAVGIDSPQRILLILPLGFLHSLDLLVNGTGDSLALTLHLLGTLQELFQRLHVKSLGAAGGIAELLVQLVHGGAVSLGILDGVRGVDAAGVGGQHLGQILLHLGFVPPDRGQFRVLHPDGQFIRHFRDPPVLLPVRVAKSNSCRAAQAAGRSRPAQDHTSGSSAAPPS